MATAHKSRVLDMTQGDPFRLVLQFSMPLFCSNLLQQLYNLTDTALALSLIHISEPTRRTPISYAVFCLKKKKEHQHINKKKKIQIT